MKLLLTPAQIARRKQKNPRLYLYTDNNGSYLMRISALSKRNTRKRMEFQLNTRFLEEAMILRDRILFEIQHGELVKKWTDEGSLSDY